MFSSAAEVCGADVLAVVLTGMGGDSGRGVRAVKAKKGEIIVEAKGQVKRGPTNLRLSHDIWDIWMGSKPISADLKTRITPCQFGGAPDCSNCGCIASAGLAAVARHRVWGLIPVGPIFDGSLKVGQHMRRTRPAAPSAA